MSKISDKVFFLDNTTGKKKVKEFKSDDISDIDIKKSFNYLMSQSTMSGGGVVTWSNSAGITFTSGVLNSSTFLLNSNNLNSPVSASGNLKWTEDFLIYPVDKGYSSDGYIELPMPSLGTTISGLGSTPSVVVNSNGIPLSSSMALYAKHDQTDHSGITYYVANYSDIPAGTLDQDYILVGVVNFNSDNIKLGLGSMVPINYTYESGLLVAE